MIHTSFCKTMNGMNDIGQLSKTNIFSIKKGGCYDKYR